MSEGDDMPFPGDFDASAFESAQVKNAREQFELLEAINRDTLNEFDPDGALGAVDIKLTIPDEEFETESPQVARSLREHMVRAIGLEPTSLDPNDPQRLFQFTYYDGVEQIRLITRPDGTEVPVATSVSFINGNESSEDYTIDSITLLTHEEAAALRERLVDNIDEQKLNRRLHEEFGMDDIFLDAADLTLEDKRAMIRSYDQIKNAETAKPDLHELDGVRSKIVRSTLPTTTLTAVMYALKADTIEDAYLTSVNKMIQRYDLDGVSARDLLESERLKRLAALNERLNKRARNAKIGKLAMSGTMVVAGTGAGAFSGYILSGAEAEALPMAATTAIGAGSAIIIARDVMKGHQKTEKSIAGFEASHQYGAVALQDQLQSEKVLAQRYSFLLARPTGA